MNKKLQVIKYLLADYLAAFLAWGLFFIYRKWAVESDVFQHFNDIIKDEKLYYGLAFIPLFWLWLYYIAGAYRKIYRKSRLKELGQTLLISFLGVTIIFFTLILDDVVVNYRGYLHFFFVLFLFHFVFTESFRLILTTRTAHRIHRKEIGFNTLIVGGNGKATEIYQEIENQPVSAGNIFIGFVHVNGNKQHDLEKYLPHLGSYENIGSIIQENNIEEVIIAIDPSEHHSIQRIITELENSDVVIKIIPDIHDMLLGSVRMTGILHAPLITIYPDLMPAWQQSVKRAMDVGVSILFMVVFSPLYLFLALGVKFSSPGPIIYSHERIGLRGKPFQIHKFRSMVKNAEENGPQLSSKTDDRITHFGRFMRRYRLDEIPQFFNVLKGEMTLVGPRPERQYYINQIVQKAPHYKLLLKVKPGITSWGQVKYGYAENVEQMIERLKFDILYIENMSLATDFKILIYTILIVLQGRGK